MYTFFLKKNIAEIPEHVLATCQNTFITSMHTCVKAVCIKSNS
jgi:hypothetical protein